MSALLDHALDVVMALPSEDQDEIARVMLALAADDGAVEPIDQAHLPAVREGLEQAEHGRIATDEAVEAALTRFGS